SPIQCGSGIAGRVSHGKRHFCQCAFWHTPGSDRQQTRNESCPDGRRQLRGRCDGQDDQPDEHCCRGRRDLDEAGGREPLVWLHGRTKPPWCVLNRLGWCFFFLPSPHTRRGGPKNRTKIPPNPKPSPPPADLKTRVARSRRTGSDE